ncbi:MAG: 1-(5-phosphoribosyl)-5-((5-phosphoribosylamino)methylideneamino)imidazole-4-carboxamide isomerase [Deltaproteobacteria bacterium]|nr:MAG: 1-(5-phosphoribosyl)-5-((5-phosphoribosylamino)methylideneamino)imidazole-4-carboxamide isomerase [Deltaproteobacteria bacterium]
MILPAIDLIDNKCVRLTQGDYEKVEYFSRTPLQTAIDYENEGFKWLHLVDLEGAKFGYPQNLETFRLIKKNTNLLIQYGGGVRSIETIEKLISFGVDRILISTLSIREKEQMKDLIKKFGSERFAFCWDGKFINGVFQVFDQGWLKSSELSLDELYQFYKDYLPSVIFITDITRDGMMSGANIELYKTLNKTYPKINIGASGGVTSLDEVHALKNFCSNVIIGKALLYGVINSQEAALC